MIIYWFIYKASYSLINLWIHWYIYQSNLLVHRCVHEFTYKHMHSYVNLRICLRIRKCLDTCTMTHMNVWIPFQIYAPNYKIMNPLLSRCLIVAYSVNHMNACIILWIHRYIYSFMYKSIYHLRTSWVHW